MNYNDFSESNAIENKAFNSIYTKMSIGLLISAITSYLLLTIFSSFLAAISSNIILVLALLFTEIGFVVYLGKNMKKDNPNLTIFFYIYSMLNSITLSVTLAYYEAGAIFAAFIVTAGMFLGLSLFGRVTNRNLSGMGKAFVALLIGILLASIVNIFLQSSMLDTIITYAGVLTFSGLIAYDNQKIKNYIINKNGYLTNGETTFFALDLYLDFVNLFLYILRLLSKNK